MRFGNHVHEIRLHRLQFFNYFKDITQSHFFFWTRFYSLEENIPLNFCMDRASKPRRGKREGAWRKLACIGKDNPETNRKHWRVQHHSVYLNNQVFTTWRKVHSEGTSANYSAFAAWLLSLEMKRREEQ